MDSEYIVSLLVRKCASLEDALFAARARHDGHMHYLKIHLTVRPSWPPCKKWPPCKQHDFKRHLAIARLVLEGTKCRSAVITIVDEIGGSKALRAANFDRLYRNHLTNGAWYREYVQERDEFVGSFLSILDRAGCLQEAIDNRGSEEALIQWIERGMGSTFM